MEEDIKVLEKMIRVYKQDESNINYSDYYICKCKTERQAIENLIKKYKDLEEHMQKFYTAELFTAKQVKLIEKDYIPKSKVREKIEELLQEGGEFMGSYHWEQIVMMLLDKIENMKAHEEEMNREINRLMEENVRLTQLLRDRDRDIDKEKKEQNSYGK